MSIEDYLDGKRITLSRPFDSRAKTLNVFYFFSFVATATFILRQLLNTNPSFPLVLLLIVLVTAFYIMSFRFINKAAFSEQLYILPQQLQLVRKGIIGQRVQVFEVAGITALQHLAKPPLTDHPLAGQSFDYLGFQTEQKVISEMHGDQRVSFRYEGRTITFGENVYSWDFEKLDALIYEITGYDLKPAPSPEELLRRELDAMNE